MNFQPHIPHVNSFPAINPNATTPSVLPAAVTPLAGQQTAYNPYSPLPHSTSPSVLNASSSTNTTVDPFAFIFAKQPNQYISPNMSLPHHCTNINGIAPPTTNGQFLGTAPQYTPSFPLQQPSDREKQLENQINLLNQSMKNMEASFKIKEEELQKENEELKKNKKLSDSLFEFTFTIYKEAMAENQKLQEEITDSLCARHNRQMQEDTLIHQLKADKARDDLAITQLSNENEQLRHEKEELQKILQRLNEAKNCKILPSTDQALSFTKHQQHDSPSKIMMDSSSSITSENFSKFSSSALSTTQMDLIHKNDHSIPVIPLNHLSPIIHLSSTTVSSTSLQIPQNTPSFLTEAAESPEFVSCNENEYEPETPIPQVLSNEHGFHKSDFIKNPPNFASSFPSGGGWLPKSQSSLKTGIEFFKKNHHRFFRQVLIKKSRWKFNNGFSKTFEIPQSSFQPRQLVQVPRGSNLSKQHTDAVIFHHVFKPAVKAVVEKYHGTNSRRHPPSSCGRSVRNFCNEFPVFPFSHENVPAKSPRAKKRSSNPYISSPHPYQKSVSKSVPLPVTSLAAAAERHPTRTQIGNNLPVIPETSQLNPIQPISPAYQNTFPLATQPSPLPPLPPPYQRNEINPQQGPIPLTSSSYNPFLSQRQSIVPTNTNYLNERQWNQQQNSIVPHVSFVPSSPSPFIPEINAERKTQSLPPLQSSSNYYSNNKNEKSAAASFIPEMTQPQNTNSVTNDEKNINENNFTKKLPVHSSTEPVRIYATQQINKSEALGNVYLEIQEGDGPRANTVNNPVKIGDKITLVIRSDDVPKDENQYNLFVHSCYASDGPGTTRIELIDKAGCGVSSQIIGQMQRERDQKTIIYFFKLTAFKFPGPDDVYFSCLVDISHNYNFPELCEKNNNITNKRFLSKRELITDNIDSIPLFNDIKVNLDNDGNEKPTQNEDHQSLKDAAETSSNNHFCLSLFSTVFLSSIIIVLTLGLIFFFVTSLILFLRLKKQRNK